MSEVLTLEESINITLKSAGFLTDSGDPVEGLIDAERAKENYVISLRHRLILNENREETKIDLIYESPATLKGRPGHSCIYFKIVDDTQDIKQIRKDIWNTGMAPLLWLIGPTNVRIYDAFARPEETDTEDDHILAVLDITSKGLKGVEEFRRELFDTGKFWESDIGKKIDPNQRVEKALLDDLWDTEKILTRDKGGLPVHIVHAILGRAIFMAYLWDRKIITSEFLKPKFGHSDMKGLLTDKKQLYNFFRWLRSTFNGDLFPIDEDEESWVENIHLKIIRAFFDGTTMKDIEKIYDDPSIPCQKRLWPYSFEIIPIELISSIYEMFAHSKDPTAARAKSIHYTKLHLVELVQSIAMLDLPDDARILDPACGSGVFLVDAFRRLVAKKKVTLERELTHDDILDILLNQIYGVDVEPGAIEVTAFSLYLALLELDENPDNPEVIKFPKLIYHSQWREDYYPTLYKQDICNWEHRFNQNEPFNKLKFDLIIGNLPWTELKKGSAPRDPDNPKSGRQWTYEYIEKENIPSKNPDQAIMIRVRDFARHDTRIAFIVASRIFYQLGKKNEKDELWFNSFLKDNNVYVVINLTDMANEKILFGGKDTGGHSRPPVMPGSVIFYNPYPSEESSTVTYICPKWYPTINKREAIIIHSPDIQTISISILRKYPYLWKIAFRGSQRDFELMKKLIENPSLKDVLHKIGIDNKKYGRGYQIVTKSTELPKPAREYKGYPMLEKDCDFKYFIDPENNLPKFQYDALHRTRKMAIFRAPLLVVRRSLKNDETRVVFIPKDTVYSETFVGFSFHDADVRVAHRLNIILNSKITLYFAFLLSREFGWFKRLIEERDWLNMPLPKSIFDFENNKWGEVIVIENKLCKSWKSASSSEIKGLEESLFKCVCDLYELNEEERIIVDDTINYTIDHFLNRKKHIQLRSIRRPTSDQLQKYANRLSKQLNGMLALEDKKVIYQLYELEHKSPLTLVEFRQTSQRAKQSNEPKKIKGIEEALKELSENVKKEISGGVYAWGHLRVYEGERLYIIKPSEKRFWSESSALNDADEIIREHMESQDGVL
ncbi:N-6 DNA Methylase [Candidatus Methanophagaceae archaeon]|nr:N-6 DNA Methylase [Methanophagales archaeon]